MGIFSKKDPNKKKAEMLLWMHGELVNLPPDVLKDKSEEERFKVYVELQLINLILLEDAIFAKLGPGAHPVWGYVVTVLHEHKMEGAISEPRYRAYHKAYFESLKSLLSAGKSEAGYVATPLYQVAIMVDAYVFGDENTATDRMQLAMEMERRFRIINDIVATDRF